MLSTGVTMIGGGQARVALRLNHAMLIRRLPGVAWHGVRRDALAILESAAARNGQFKGLPLRITATPMCGSGR